MTRHIQLKKQTKYEQTGYKAKKQAIYKKTEQNKSIQFRSMIIRQNTNRQIKIIKCTIINNQKKQNRQDS